MIEKIDDDFDLVLIADRMDESMVLLADALCLPLANVTGFKVNARKESRVQQLTDGEKKTLRSALKPDQRLYDHFVGRLDERIRYGQP